MSGRWISPGFGFGRFVGNHFHDPRVGSMFAKLPLLVASHQRGPFVFKEVAEHKAMQVT